MDLGCLRQRRLALLEQADGNAELMVESTVRGAHGLRQCADQEERPMSCAPLWR